ncbi:hypothetical protein THAOC_36817 [Thalassiosira oceanica]|uniref:Uncharacterized protein n=1 Tax=Thalassiosira oceanica TaxID=159749 RepID=K0R7I2_THAOC|nr:hypothetical protein THAOC_36817 [Thalassiosira oceanica]|eukprot:EJK44631.1 hypothetical protein THAOC_36817 [Thalassiosira oceanica]
MMNCTTSSKVQEITLFHCTTDTVFCTTDCVFAQQTVSLQIRGQWINTASLHNRCLHNFNLGSVHNMKCTTKTPYLYFASGSPKDDDVIHRSPSEAARVASTAPPTPSPPSDCVGGARSGQRSSTSRRTASASPPAASTPGSPRERALGIDPLDRSERDKRQRAPLEGDRMAIPI